jgi:DNA excision repair protein ERCC-1
MSENVLIPVDILEDDEERITEPITIQTTVFKPPPLIPVGVIKPKQNRPIVRSPVATTTVQSTETFPSEKNVIFASTRQRENPLLKHLLHVKVVFKECIPDFVIGKQICILFISIRFHISNPKYLYDRIQQLTHLFSLRIVLCKIDHEEHENHLLNINEMCMHGDCTLILCWSDIEAARYIETYKLYEKKSATIIQPKVENDYIPRLQETLTSIKSVNKTDAITLASNFGSLKSIMNANTDELNLCPGMGEKKAKRMLDLFQAPFINDPKNENIEIGNKPKQSKMDDFVKIK